MEQAATPSAFSAALATVYLGSQRDLDDGIRSERRGCTNQSRLLPAHNACHDFAEKMSVGMIEASKRGKPGSCQNRKKTPGKISFLIMIGQDGTALFVTALKQRGNGESLGEA